jgi:transposase
VDSFYKALYYQKRSEVWKKRKKRRVFNEEFKREAIELTEKIGVSQVKKELDIDESTLRAWRKKAQNSDSGTSGGKKSYSELEQENRRLTRENGYLKEINKVLKKSTAIFSNDQLGNLK